MEPFEYLLHSIKTLRIKIDALIQLVDTPELKSAETVKCQNELMLGKAFLGKILGELNQPTPYVNDGKRESVKDIEPTDARADVSILEHWPTHKEEDGDIKLWSVVKKVDYLREEIRILIETDLTEISRNMIDEMPVCIDHSISDPHILLDVYEAEVLVCLTKARFWLGFELERIRKTETGS
jgi:hypothetical protein